MNRIENLINTKIQKNETIHNEVKPVQKQDIILMVDDDAGNLTLAQKILGKEFRVAIANSGAAALKYLKNHKPDLILMDINMPQMNGLETMERLQKLPGMNAVPIICLTADTSTEMEVTCLKKGAIDFIAKPFVTEVLLGRVHRILELTHYRERLEEMVEIKARQLERVTLQAITAIANIIDTKDEYTKGHSIRVANYSSVIAQKLGWPEEEIQNLKYAGLLHDVGKIGVSDAVLNKPGRLTNVEFEMIKSHTIIGGEILKDITMISHASDVARHHHERYDGSGYPDGLMGEGISLHARIISICDAYDAMSSNRVYRGRLPEEAIINELRHGRGTQFDPEVLDAFLDLVLANKIQSLCQEENGYTTIADEGNQLLLRVMNDINAMRQKEEERDYLTGLLTRKDGDGRIIAQITEDAGALILIDMDNLKYVNDVHGHLAGDFALKTISAILLEEENIIASRYGGDEFLCFILHVDRLKTENMVKAILQKFEDQKRRADILNQTSLSVGICMTQKGDAYEKAFQRADQALYYVKKTSKNGYAFFSGEVRNGFKRESVDLQHLINSLQSRHALNFDFTDFQKICQYIQNLSRRYNYSIQMVMLTVTEKRQSDNEIMNNQERIMSDMNIAIRKALRGVDIVTRYSSMQYLIVLTDSRKENVEMILQRILDRFYEINGVGYIEISYDVAEFGGVEGDA